jgi:hypothetical protein
MSLRIKLHIQGIKGSGPIKQEDVDKGEVAGALFGGLLEIDGQIIDQSIEVRYRSHEGFFEVVPVLAPGSFEVVTHTKESWPELLKELERQERVRNMNGQLIARNLKAVEDDDGDE